LNNAYCNSEHASENQYIVRALKAGALGYLTKYTVSDDLLKAIKQALYGKRYIYGSAGELHAGTVVDHNIDLPPTLISDREFKVLTLIRAGKSIS
jgi:two-component system, NarL family, invasion response regulator UvrY